MSAETAPPGIEKPSGAGAGGGGGGSVPGADAFGGSVAVSNAIADQGRAPGHGENSSELHRRVAENIDHLVNLGLAEYTGDTPRTAQLTAAGKDAVASMP